MSYYEDGIVTLLHGDAIEQMRAMEDCSVDAVVTDPPYGLEFMGKDWDRFPGKIPGRGARIQEERAAEMTPTGKGHSDSKGPYLAARVDQYIAGTPYQEWCTEWARECLRVLKPGGYILAFGGTRTVHRLASAIEDAGFEIRDALLWIYLQGFPKSHNLTGDREGWGTALKPAWEPVVMARKPFKGTVAANVLEHGTGAINIDGCRIPYDEGESDPSAARKAHGFSEAAKKALGATVAAESASGFSGEVVGSDSSKGRWPSNVILTDEVFDGQFPDEVVGGGTSSSGFMSPDQERQASYGGGGYHGGFVQPPTLNGTYGDEGGKSRFFIIPKADRGERERGLTPEGDSTHSVKLTAKAGAWLCPCGRKYMRGFDACPRCGSTERVDYTVGQPGRVNDHPTVKPIDLLKHLVRLVTPPGGLILDPFVGSGTTALAASEEGFRCIGIDQEEKYLKIAVGRLRDTDIGMGLA